MKKDKFIPHRFWIDGVLFKDVETFQDLAKQIIKDSMKSNGLTFRKNNKKNTLKHGRNIYLQSTKKILIQI